ncbi:MAG: LysM peptidoglycan-binding domain-containing protein [Candidatus Obscuribacter sp.]|nr:LysM peptidoglycan-binding domain-containing protein [Candidatus Obscuribacter sp.]
MAADNITAPAPRDRIADTTLPSKQDPFDVFQDYRNGGPDLAPPKSPQGDQTQPRVTNTSIDKVEPRKNQTVDTSDPANGDRAPQVANTEGPERAPATQNPVKAEQTAPIEKPVNTDQTRPAPVPDLSIVSGRDAVYTVKPGDNLWNIANRYLSEQRKTATGTDANKPVTPREINDLVGKIFEANKGNGKDQIKNRDRIYPNQHLTIPGFGAPEAPKPAETPQEPAKPAETPQVPAKPAETPQVPAKPAETPQVPAKPAETPQTPVLETPQVPAKPAETPQEPAKQPEVNPNATEVEKPKPVETPVQAPVENFTPPNGSKENPTVGAEVAAKEAETLLRHFDQIPGKADPAYVDATALNNYLKSNTNLSEDDKRWLTSAASHLGRIQKSSNDEWGRETSGATRADLEAYPRQEKSFEEQYTARNYIKTNFDNMAGADGILNISELRAWTQKAH